MKKIFYAVLILTGLGWPAMAQNFVTHGDFSPCNGKAIIRDYVPGKNSPANGEPIDDHTDENVYCMFSVVGGQTGYNPVMLRPGTGAPVVTSSGKLVHRKCSNEIVGYKIPVKEMVPPVSPPPAPTPTPTPVSVPTTPSQASQGQGQKQEQTIIVNVPVQQQQPAQQVVVQKGGSNKPNWVDYANLGLNAANLLCGTGLICPRGREVVYRDREIYRDRGGYSPRPIPQQPRQPIYRPGDRPISDGVKNVPTVVYGSPGTVRIPDARPGQIIRERNPFPPGFMPNGLSAGSATYQEFQPAEQTETAPGKPAPNLKSKPIPRPAQ